MFRTLDRPQRLSVLKWVLRPIVRFCLRRAYSYHDYVEVSKRLFIEVAEAEIRKTSTKVNVSRIAVMTGMYRGDVDKLMRHATDPSPEAPDYMGRVIGQWGSDERFCTRAGGPRVLSFRGDNNEFQELVATVSTAINSGTVLFELERCDLVERTPKGLKLKKLHYRPSVDPLKYFPILSQELDSHLQALEENIENEQSIANLHLFTQYDNVSQAHVQQIRDWMLKQGKEFHRRARSFISKYDLDINPKLSSTLVGGAKVYLGAFSTVAIDNASASAKAEPDSPVKSKKTRT